MFVTGTKIVLKNSKVSYIVTKDSLCEPEIVEVWMENKGFVEMSRKHIIADIVAGAYVTNVTHNVTSKACLESSIFWAVKDTLDRWGFLIPEIADVDTAVRIRKTIIAEVLERVGRDLLVDIKHKNVSVGINGGEYLLQRMILDKLEEVYDEAF